MIDLKHVSKRYGQLVALQPTDLTVRSGETTVLIGPSGCGKSTLLRLIMGLTPPSRGEILIDGQALNSGSVLRLRRRMGYVIQDGGLFPHLTARENVLLMGRHPGNDRARLEDRLAELCTLTRFPTDGLDRYPVEISGGQRQRVGLMRALMLEPAVLLLDEPLGALDPIVRASLQTDLKRIFMALRQTVLLVTHDMAEAGYIGDDIVLLSEGRVVQRGSLDALRSAPASPFVTEFINAQRSLVML